jgi:hypothetical protein
MAGLELDQDIRVAVGAEVLPQHGPEEGELPDVVATAELLYGGSGNVKLGTLHASTSLSRIVSPNAMDRILG